ncbi:Signal peptidase I [Streptococcus infantarius subsp. infantarius]|nr:Signal peptidase I [Streptococcus infantarius subsp. infantarius]
MKPLFEKKSEKIALADLPKAGDMVVSVSKKNLKQGDVVAFYYNNKVLVKRVIATSGQ